LNYDFLWVFWLEEQLSFSFQNHVAENIFGSAGMEQSSLWIMTSPGTHFRFCVPAYILMETTGEGEIS